MIPFFTNSFFSFFSFPFPPFFVGGLVFYAIVLFLRSVI